MNGDQTLTDTEVKVSQAADFVRSEIGEDRILSHAIILGSGLGAVGDQMVDAGGLVLPFHRVPNMPEPAVTGHAGRIVVGTGQHDHCVFVQGRVHYYEGHSLDHLLFATRLLARLGVGQLVVTNAAGGIRSRFLPGDLMLLDGHLSMPSIQQMASRPCFRVTDLLWNAEWRHQALQIPTSLKIHTGCYAMMSGPNYETPAEVRALRALGADAAGMSTVPEAILAARSGIKVLGVSCITNVASGLSDQPLDHAEVKLTAGRVETEFSQWVLQLLAGDS